MIRAADRSRFFARTALLMLACVLASFPVTYFLPLINGTRHFSPLYHIHGAAFFAWMMLYAWQSRLVANGHVARHRELGLAGVAISALLLPLGLAIAIAGVRRRMAEGNLHPFDNTLYNVIDIGSFSLLMIASIAAVTRHPDWHKRFTFAAALCLVGPAISRWFMAIPSVPPYTDFGPNILADLFFVALIAHDLGKSGRIHPATLWVTIPLVPIHFVTPFFTASDWWRGLAPGLLHLSS